MDKNAEFVSAHGEELAMRIFENFYGDRNDSDIVVEEKQPIDRECLNWEGKVTILLSEEQELTVELRDGNWGGSEITDFYN